MSISSLLHFINVYFSQFLILGILYLWFSLIPLSAEKQVVIRRIALGIFIIGSLYYFGRLIGPLIKLFDSTPINLMLKDFTAYKGKEWFDGVLYGICWSLYLALIVRLITTELSLFRKSQVAKTVEPLEVNLNNILDQLNSLAQPGEYNKKKFSITKSRLRLYFYLDKSDIEQLAKGIPFDYEPVEKQRKVTIGKKIGWRFFFKLIGRESSSNESGQLVETYRQQTELADPTERVIDYMLKNEEVLFGSEDFEWKDIQGTIQAKMNEIIDSKAASEKFKETAPQNIKGIMRKISLEKKEGISKSLGYIVIRSEFRIEATDGFIFLQLFHRQLNKFLKRNEHVSFQIKCLRNNFLSSWEENFENRPTLRMTCLGRILGWNNLNSCLEIHPIALY